MNTKSSSPVTNPDQPKKTRRSRERATTVAWRSLTEKEFCARYGVGRTRAWELRKSRAVLVRRVGAEPKADKNGNVVDHRRVLFDFDSAEAWYANLPSNAKGAAQ
jgi:hypothetical protein